MIQSECKIHGLSNHFKRKGRESSLRCSKCSSDYVTQYRRKIKAKAIEYKGGKCEKCGYKKSHWSMGFHHLDPSQKDFEISRCHTKNWESVRIELDKCMLVCSNCHRRNP